MWIDLLVLLLGLLGFSLLVAVHELGHFSVAKLCGVLIYDFSVGMGTRLFGRRWGNTECNLRVLPIGGYVSLHGEPGAGGPHYRDNLTHWLAGRKISSARALLDRKRRLRNRPWYQQLAIAVAGPAASVLLGFLLFLGLNLVSGVARETPTVGVTIKDVAAGGPAQSAGIQPGDIVLAINGHSVSTLADLTTEIQLAGRFSQEVTLKRQLEIVSLRIVPQDYEQPGSFRSKLGIGVFVSPNYSFERGKPLIAAADAFDRTRAMLVLQCRAIWSLVSGRIALTNVGGPVGNLYVVSSTLYESIPRFVSVLAIISIGLGVMNMLPLLPLDGGRALFALIHGIRGKPMPHRIQVAVSASGMCLMLGFMLLTVVMDSRTLNAFAS